MVQQSRGMCLAELTLARLVGFALYHSYNVTGVGVMGKKIEKKIIAV